MATPCISRSAQPSISTAQRADIEPAEQVSRTGEAGISNAQSAYAEAARLREFSAFFRSRPDVKPTDIPDEVLQAVGRGETLASAYLTHENNVLRGRLEALEQEKKNAERSTGSAESAGRAASDAFDTLWYSD